MVSVVCGLKILFSLWSLFSVPGVPVSPGSVPWRPWPPTQPSARDPKPIHSGATMLIHGVQDRPQQALVVAQAPWTTSYKKLTGSRLHPPLQCVSDSEYIYLNTGWQKLSGRTDSVRQKYGLEENFKPQHTLFVAILRFLAIYALFGRVWAKKVFFWGAKSSVFWGKKCTVAYIAYSTKLNFQISNYAQKQHIFL